MALHTGGSLGKRRVRSFGFAALPVIFLGQFAPSQCTPQPRCHSSYAGQCLPIVQDLDRPDIRGTVRVVGPGVYRLGADRDGIGCERN